MLKLLRAALALLVAAALPALAHAGAEEDALAALDAANAKVSGLSAVRSPGITNIDRVRGELSSLPPFFQTVATRLQGIPLDSSSRLLSLGGSINAKIETAGRTSSVDIQVLIETCRGLVADLDAWRALLPQVRAELLKRVDAKTQALIASQVNQAFPTAVADVVSVGNSQPTATPVVWPTATAVAALPTLVPSPTPIVLPGGDGGLIPGGPPAGPPPTPVPAGQPTAVPTPRATLKLPVPLAVGRNNQTVWVGNVQAGTVGVFDTRTRRFTAEIRVGSSPSSLALDDGDQTLVVANAGSNNVSLIDARGNEVVKTLGVGARPVQVLVTHEQKAYVACQDGRRVDVIDVKRQMLVKSITLSSRPGRMDLPNSHQAIYVTLPDEDRIAVIDTGIDEVTASAGE